jgi:hypothetical protein
MYRDFYNQNHRRMLFKTSRQVAKSTTLGILQILECVLIPHFSTMFISPTREQTTRFSNTRISKMMRYSPIINRTFLHPDLADRVFHKQFTNGAEMLFTYAIDDPDRLRGPSTDHNFWDEVQDILWDPTIIVGNETMSMSHYARETYAGTPKTMENTIQYLWETSSQTEWVIKCDSCNKLQYIETDKSMGVNGIICLKCGAYLNPFKGVWVDMNSFKNSLVPELDRLKGFHISQLIMPINNPHAMEKVGRNSLEVEFAQQQWNKIKTKHAEAPPSIFRNEVLGISDAIGTRMISQQELETICVSSSLSERPNPKIMEGITTVTAGVDWSGGGITGISRTVIWIWGFHPKTQKKRCLFYKVFPGINPVNNVNEIAIICDAYKIALVVGDAGEGHTANDLLRSKIGYSRVHQVQYCSATNAIKWNGQDRYMADKTTMVDNFFLMLKHQQAEFGPIREMKTAIDDMLNEYEDITPSGKRVWRHSPQKPDDCLHAGIFGWIALKMIQNDVKFYH